MVSPTVQRLADVTSMATFGIAEQPPDGVGAVLEAVEHASNPPMKSATSARSFCR